MTPDPHPPTPTARARGAVQPGGQGTGPARDRRLRARRPASQHPAPDRAVATPGSSRVRFSCSLGGERAGTTPRIRATTAAAERARTTGYVNNSDRAHLAPADRAAVSTLASALAHARRMNDQRPPLLVLAASLAELGIQVVAPAPSGALVRLGRDEWLRRLRSAARSQSTINAYRDAINDLLRWADHDQCDERLFEERAIVAYFDDYRKRCSPAPATYHRRFVLLRRFLRWLSRREGVPDPFADLEAPPKPHQESDWLTPEEFARLLAAAGKPARRVVGLADRDRLVLLALVTTGLRRSELIALNWRDLALDGPHPSLLVRHGKGDKTRRQPLADQLAAEIRQLQQHHKPAPSDPVFRGLRGERLQPTRLADIIRRAAARADIDKRITAHTLRHTAATWLRQTNADTRLVAEYLGHADLSTVSRYAHVASDELHAAAEQLAMRAGLEVSGPLTTIDGS